ncbi:hypothetical protein L207DRAFT_588894 [Hyaloscypha variabilis F]|uniref:Uncharacterized protein n=1 Tax=Hyaloscypha variabilis (strain UAMH 11265 / GT02V1 / F) TaxID=1149755 RepID=A0A2J6R704_HYAVF|nr:hypothetical protein L207DRAFT_588894 [Hyaloscypha variabilis F]
MKFFDIVLSAFIASRAICAAPYTIERDVSLVEDRSPILQHDVAARLENANAAEFTVVNQVLSNFRTNLGTAAGKLTFITASGTLIYSICAMTGYQQCTAITGTYTSGLVIVFLLHRWFAVGDHGFTYDNITTILVKSYKEALSDKSGGQFLTTRVFLAVLKTSNSAANQDIIVNNYANGFVTLYLPIISTGDPGSTSSNKRSREY